MVSEQLTLVLYGVKEAYLYFRNGKERISNGTKSGELDTCNIAIMSIINNDMMVIELFRID